MNLKSLIYVPGNDPQKIRNALIFDVNIIVIDLEDSVPNEKKDEARILVKHAISSLPFTRPIYIRVNSSETEYFQRDIKELIDLNIEGFRIPKVSSQEQLESIISIISNYEHEANTTKKKLILTIEDARGLNNMNKFINVEDRIVAISPGFADLSKNLGFNLYESTMIDYIRCQIIIASRILGVAAIDGIFPNINDVQGLKEDCKKAKAMGFNGKSAIHPIQLEIINEFFSLTKEEIEEAEDILKTYENLGYPGSFNYKGRMVDKPFIEKYYQIFNKKLN